MRRFAPRQWRIAAVVAMWLAGSAVAAAAPGATPLDPPDPVDPPVAPSVAPVVEPPPAPAPAAPAEPAEPASDSPVTVTTRVTPDPSSIGDLLSYEITAAFPRGVSVNLPSVLQFEPLHFVSVNEAEAEPTGEGMRKVFTVQLQRFEVGPAEIPAFALTYVDAAGQVQTVDVPAHAFVVDALLANEVDPVRRGEDPPVSIEYPNHRAEIIAYSVLGGLLLGLLGLLVWRRIAARKKPVFVPPPIPPHQVALGALDELEHGNLLERGEFVDYYLQLTEIAKGYLQGRFGVGALDRTTEEIRRELIRNPASVAPLSIDEVVAFLQRCDLVKFARMEPEKDEARAQTGQVRSLVERTMVVAKTARPSGEGASAVAPASAPKAEPEAEKPEPENPEAENPEAESRDEPPTGGPQ